jgi:hypothetical protein
VYTEATLCVLWPVNIGLLAAVVAEVIRNSPKTEVKTVALARVVPIVVQPAVVLMAVSVVLDATPLTLRRSVAGPAISREPGLEEPLVAVYVLGPHSTEPCPCVNLQTMAACPARVLCTIVTTSVVVRAFSTLLYQIEQTMLSELADGPRNSCALNQGFKAVSVTAVTLVVTLAVVVDEPIAYTRTKRSFASAPEPTCPLRVMPIVLALAVAFPVLPARPTEAQAI